MLEIDSSIHECLQHHQFFGIYRYLFVVFDDLVIATPLVGDMYIDAAPRQKRRCKGSPLEMPR